MYLFAVARLNEINFIACDKVLKSIIFLNDIISQFYFSRSVQGSTAWYILLEYNFFTVRFIILIKNRFEKLSNNSNFHDIKNGLVLICSCKGNKMQLET